MYPVRAVSVPEGPSLEMAAVAAGERVFQVTPDAGEAVVRYVESLGDMLENPEAQEAAENELRRLGVSVMDLSLDEDITSTGKLYVDFLGSNKTDWRHAFASFRDVAMLLGAEHASNTQFESIRINGAGIHKVLQLVEHQRYN